MKNLYLILLLSNLIFLNFAKAQSTNLMDYKQFLKTLPESDLLNELSEDIIEDTDGAVSLDILKSKLDLRIDRSCIVNGELSLPPIFTLSKLKQQARELLIFHSEMIKDLNAVTPLAFNLKTIKVCSKRYQQQYKLVGETLHFNPESNLQSTASKILFGEEEHKPIDAWSIRRSWDIGQIFESHSLKLKAAWFMLNPVGTIQMQFRQVLDKTIEKVIRYRANQMSKEQVSVLNDSNIREEILAAKIKSTIKGFGSLQKNLKQFGLVNVGNYHDIEVSVYINTEVDTLLDPTDVDVIDITQIGLVNVYTVDEISIQLSISEREIINISKYFTDVL